MNDLVPNPSVVLEEQLSDLYLNQKKQLLHLDKWLQATAIAIPAVLRAANAGNVTCLEAAREILEVLK